MTYDVFLEKNGELTQICENHPGNKLKDFCGFIRRQLARGNLQGKIRVFDKNGVQQQKRVWSNIAWDNRPLKRKKKRRNVIKL
jgi:hypothetical protein